MKIQDNRIVLKNKEIIFKNNILEAVENKGKFIVVFNTKEDDGFDNVYCYNENQKLIWRIKPAPIEIGGTARTAYVGVDMLNGTCRVIDFFGRRFTVNIENGEIISKDIVK